MKNILEIKGIRKSFAGTSFSLHGIDLDIPYGSVMGLIGENGAGKTSLIKIIMNIYGRGGGSIKAFGSLDTAKDEAAFKEQTGYVSDEDYLYFNTTIEKTAAAFSMAFGTWNSEVFNKYMKMWQIDTKKKCSTLSKGMKTKVMLALALAHDPKLLILDEPTAGLDPAARIEILDILRDFVSDGEHSVLFSTHITGDLDKIADYISMMIDGTITEVLSADEAQDKYAVISGDVSDMPKKGIIGAKITESSYEALALRSDLPHFRNVAVRTPNYEDLLVHTILQNRANRSR